MTPRGSEWLGQDDSGAPPPPHCSPRNPPPPCRPVPRPPQLPPCPPEWIVAPRRLSAGNSSVGSGALAGPLLAGMTVTVCPGASACGSGASDSAKDASRTERAGAGAGAGAGATSGRAALRRGRGAGRGARCGRWATCLATGSRISSTGDATSTSGVSDCCRVRSRAGTLNAVCSAPSEALRHPAAAAAASAEGEAVRCAWGPPGLCGHCSLYRSLKSR